MSIHPHVFDGVTYESDEELHAAWEEIKNMKKKGRNGRPTICGMLSGKLNILKQTRDRSPMPRPAVFRNRKKYDRNIMKDISRKKKETE